MQVEISVIGERGSGKSRVLEMLRRALQSIGGGERQGSGSVSGADMEVLRTYVPNLTSDKPIPGELSSFQLYHALQDSCAQQSNGSWVIVFVKPGENPGRSDNLVCSSLNEDEARHIAGLLNDNPIPGDLSKFRFETSELPFGPSMVGSLR